LQCRERAVRPSGRNRYRDSLAKNLSFLSTADAAGIVLDARVPVILT
jgi:hypothetical protein